MQRRNTYARASLKVFSGTLALLAAATAGLASYPPPSHARPLLGTAAPDFVLKATDGRNLRLSEYRGDLVVLSFWASWCGPCRETLVQLDAIGTATGEGDTVVLSINVEGDAARAAAVAGSLGIGYPTLVDARRTVSRLYDVDRLPLTLLLDRDGVIRGVWTARVVSGEDIAWQVEELNP